MLKSIWTWFVGLSTKVRATILISFVLITVVTGLSDKAVESGGDEIVTKASPNPSPTTTVSATPQVTATPSTSPSPETPLEFRFAALRDLQDLRKDVKDAKNGITQEGLGKFYWNMVEVQFNLSQLEMLLPREEYAEKWKSKLMLLSQAVEAIDTDDENLTISSAKSKLDKILQTIPALEKIAKSLAN